jgi:hypothetical protein
MRPTVMMMVAAVLVGMPGGIGGARDAIAAEKARKQRNPEQMLQRRDKDRDGKLSRAEFLGNRAGAKRDKAAKVFDRRDRDGDGLLTVQELKAKAGKKGAKQGAQPGGKKGKKNKRGKKS